MYCEKCGKELNSGAKICDGCGAAVKSSEPSSAAAEPSNANRNNDPSLISRAKRAVAKNKKLRMVRNIAIIIAAFVIVASIAFCALKRSDREVLIENYLNAQSTGDGVVLQKYIADPYYLKYVTSKDGFDIDDDRVSYFFRAMAEDSMDSYEGYYGDNVKCTVKIDHTRKFDADDIKDIAEYLEENYAYDPESVQNVLLIEYEGNIKGDSVSADYKQGRAVLIKVNKKWYVSRLLSKNVIEDILM